MVTEENEILDYETCKLLKEVGFDEPCDMGYITAVRHNGKDLSYDDELDLKSDGRENEIEYIEGGNLVQFYNKNSIESCCESGIVSAPDIYTAMRWYRRERDVNIEIGYNGDIHCWCWSSTHCSTGDAYPYDNYGFDGYESAAKDAILYFVKNVLKLE